MTLTKAMQAGTWPTNIKVQCRNEPPFYAKIQFHPIPGKGLTPYINCVHCARGYFLEPSGEWIADRPLVILGQK